MSVRGMMQTVFLTELIELNTDISKDTLNYIMESIRQFEGEAFKAGYYKAKEVYKCELGECSITLNEYAGEYNRVKGE